MKITFTAFDRGSVVGSLTGSIRLNGTAVASESEQGNLSVAKNAVTQFYEGDWVSGARSAFGFLAGNTLPSLNISLAGEVTGLIEGASVSYPRGPGDVFFQLWHPDELDLPIISAVDGGPAAVQRCKTARWGALYLSDAYEGGVRDPRPNIPVMFNNCLTYPKLQFGAYGCNTQNGSARAATMQLGTLRIGELLRDPPRLRRAPITLEVVLDRDIGEPGFAGSLPGNQVCPETYRCFDPDVILRARFVPVAGGRYRLAELGEPLPSVSVDDWIRNWSGIPGYSAVSETGRIKAYVRWSAMLLVPGQQRPLSWEYALDVTDRLEIFTCDRNNSGCAHRPTNW